LTTSELAALGIAALKEGHREAARRLLTEAVARNPLDATAWLWLSGALDDDEQRADCLRRALQIEPDNAAARAGLEHIEMEQRRAVVQCSVCGETGRITCPKCGGRRTEPCAACEGQAFQKCETCRGLGWLADEGPVLISSLKSRQGEQWHECPRCEATGVTDCQACRGQGRDWCHTCEGSGHVICPNCAPARLKQMLGDELAQAVLDALWRNSVHAQSRLAALANRHPLAAFLWRTGFADQPYRSTRKLRGWVESRASQDSSARRLLALLPQAPYEQLPPHEKPVQLIKKNPPTAASPDNDLNLVMPTHPANALQDAVLAARIGNRDQAMVLLLQLVEREPRNAEAWLWLSRVVETDQQRIECLRRAIEINPHHQVALADLARLTQQ
jgi:tetratricopeptide (TPR) repeat protein